MSGATPRSRGGRADDALVVGLPEIVVGRGSVATSRELMTGEYDALVLPVAPPPSGETDVQPRSGTADAAARYGIDLGDLAARLRPTGAAGESHTVELPRGVGATTTLPWDGLPRRLVLVGVGGGGAADLRRAGAAVARATRGLRGVITTVGADAGADGTRAVAEGYLLGAYRHPSWTTGRPAPGPAERLLLLGRYAEGAVEAARRNARASWVARTLASTPSSTKTPAWLADRAVELATASGLSTEVLGPEELAARGFGGLLAVGGGSEHGPRLVTVTYEPDPEPAGAGAARTDRRTGRRRAADPRHVVLVGKGITYDTGGISIKPRESMVSMKTDMTGAAVVLAAVLGAAAAGVRHRVTALLPLAENAFGASSYRPGDVLRVHGGTTVEIANTDAEGRIVLADALAHADADLDPDVLVDVATLTGAATLGLGRGHGALYATDDRLAAALVAAGEDTGEPLWRMPLVADYGVAVESSVADLRHVPLDASIGGGSITAALFLQRFVGTRSWAHLDVAGPARSPRAEHELPEGATGFGARLLVRWLTRLR